MKSSTKSIISQNVKFNTMKTLCKFHLILITIFCSTQLMAQKAALKAANRKFEEMSYHEAIPLYLRVLKKDSMYVDAIVKIANSYRLTNNMYQAEKWYKKAVSLPGASSIQRHHYGKALLANGKYAEATEWIKRYSSDNTSYLFRSISDFALLMVDSADYRVTPLSINSENADFGAIPYRDGIVFVSSRKSSGPVKRTHSWTGQPFLSLYYSWGRRDNFREPVRFDNEINNKYNNGPSCFSKDGEEIWITRNNYSVKKQKRKSELTMKLQLFHARNNGPGMWTKLVPFPYNSDKYNCAHPSLSADGKRLYFASDMEGSIGGMDIFVCYRNGEVWSKPINLGPLVNTIDNEVFPHITDDDMLYFSSDGWGGLGGLDLMISKTPRKVEEFPLNVGSPINTNGDDFGLQYDRRTHNGYISSNRKNGGLDDDIFYIQRKKVSIHGIVVDKESGEPVSGAMVELQNDSNTQSFLTTENGHFMFAGSFDKDYLIFANAENKGSDSLRFDTRDLHPGQPFIRLELGTKKSPSHKIKFIVIDASTREPIAEAKILNPETKDLIGTTGPDGIYTQPLIPEQDEQFMISAKGYRPKLILMEGQKDEKPQDMTFIVEMVSTSIAMPFSDWYKIIYYDFDKSEIRSDAIPVLDEVALFLKENNNVCISITSSTDSRASAEYNEGLSKRRSMSTRQYLLDKGVKPNQLARIKWTGESVLVNECDDLAPCTEEMHQLNRRSEMVVIEVR